MLSKSEKAQYQRTRRQLPQRIQRLRWLRDALGDPLGCDRRTEIDEARVTVCSCGDGRLELRVEPAERAERLADEFFGRRYKTHTENANVVFVGRPL